MFNNRLEMFAIVASSLFSAAVISQKQKVGIRDFMLMNNLISTQKLISTECIIQNASLIPDVNTC